METPIKISYRWNADEMLLLSRLHMRHSSQLRKSQRSTRSGAVIFIFMGLLGFCVMGVTTAHPGATLIEQRDTLRAEGGQSYSGRLAIFEYEDVFAGSRIPV